MNARTKPSAAWAVAALRSDPDAPYAAMIEIADRCNEVCVHCYQVQGQKGEMSTQDVERVMDQLAEMGVLFLTLSGGEATLRKDFLELVAYARKLRFSVKIYTNGLTMTEALASELARLAVQEVQISLYSHRAGVHDWVTGVPGAFEKTVAGVRRLLSVGVRTVLKTPMMSFNADEYDEYIRFAESLGCDFMLDPTLHSREDGDRSPESLSISDEDYLRLQADPRLVGEQKRNAGHDVPLDARPCGACSGNVHIEANGEIRPCGMLTLPTGNALREGVRAAWYENAEALAIRQLRWGDIHGCRDCDLRRHCHRCYADAQLRAGDALGPYADACREARLNYESTHGVEPRIVASPGRDPAIGPYRLDSPHCFVTIPDRVTESDEAMARSHPWIRSAATDSSTPHVNARPGGLVQLRRPGKRPRSERIPGACAESPHETSPTEPDAPQRATG